jgi:hypothetical protein
MTTFEATIIRICVSRREVEEAQCFIQYDCENDGDNESIEGAVLDLDPFIDKVEVHWGDDVDEKPDIIITDGEASIVRPLAFRVLENDSAKDKLREVAEEMNINNPALINALRAMLDPPFRDLESHGILCRHNYTCCLTCGVAEITDEMKCTSAKGFVFYHSQDTEGVLVRRDLYLAFGSRSGLATDTLAVGRLAVAILRASGLLVAWEGNIRRRICVAPPADVRDQLAKEQGGRHDDEDSDGATAHEES